MPPIHFLDFEGDARSGVVEYGVVTWSGPGRLVPGPTRICGPRQAIRSAATAVHGLDAKTTAGAAPFAADRELFHQLRATGLLGAHFASAEHRLLRATWPYPPASPDHAFGGPAVADWGPWIDTARLARLALGPSTSLELAGLVDHLGCRPRLARLAEAACPQPRRHFHAALYDALAAACLFDALLPRLTAEGETLPAPARLVLASAASSAAAHLSQPGLF